MMRAAVPMLLSVLVACSNVDAELTNTFRVEFVECMRNRGIVVEAVDVEVTQQRHLRVRGYGSDVEDEGDAGTECENALIRRHGLVPG